MRYENISKVCRPVAPTAEQRSPKPTVGGSNPSGPATNFHYQVSYMKIFQGLRRFFGKIGSFLRETRSELRKVIWPSAGELRVFTVAVLFAMVSVGVILWGTDGLLTLFMSFITKK